MTDPTTEREVMRDALMVLADTLDAAVDRADRLEKALRQIVHYRFDVMVTAEEDLYDVKGIAERALAGVPAEPATEEKRTWDERYDEAMQWRDWQTCDQLIEERDAASSVLAGAGQMVRVVGKCPKGCGETLFLGDGGYVTCSWRGCPDPGAADGLLSAGAGQVPADTIDLLASKWRARADKADELSHGNVAHLRGHVSTLRSCANELDAALAACPAADADTIEKARNLAEEYDRGWRHDTLIPHEWAARAYYVLVALAAVRTPEEQT